MMHRDIKPDNIFIFAKKHYKLGLSIILFHLPLYSIILGDLGLSKDITTLAPAVQSQAGTPFVLFFFCSSLTSTFVVFLSLSGYIAPEVTDSQMFAHLNFQYNLFSF